MVQTIHQANATYRPFHAISYYDFVTYNGGYAALRNISMTALPLHRIATVIPFVDYLHQSGVPVERELHRARLPVLAMEDPDCFIPSRNYWTFIANVAKRWQPRQIGLATDETPGKTIRACFPNTHFHQGESHCFITLGNRLLGKQPRLDEDALLSSPRYSRIKPPGDFIGALKLVLRSYLRDGAPSVELAAEIAELSPRTLQRRLADAGLTYRDLLIETRYETAIDLMQDTEHSITDIASLLGYTDPSHFARAFRRMAGVSPREYLQQSQV